MTTITEHESRRACWPARKKILQAVNRHLMSQKRYPTLVSPRTIQKAACIARRFALVDARTMRDAGFNPKGVR